MLISSARRILDALCLTLFCITPVQAQDYLSFQSYDGNELRMTLVTASTKGELMLSPGDGRSPAIPLHNAKLDGLFTARIPIPCGQLREPVVIFWLVKGKAALSAKVPAQRCAPLKPVLPPVHIVVHRGQCFIDTGGNTLWRTATELARHNDATVYQNIYGLFITNKMGFKNADVLYLQKRMLICPSIDTLTRIEPEHARRLFSEAMEFQRQVVSRRKSTAPIVEQRGGCTIDMRKKTLWRAANELAHSNGYSVYQNIYALFITNRTAFANEDISRLHRSTLRCPAGTALSKLSLQSARQFFERAESK